MGRVNFVTPEGKTVSIPDDEASLGAAVAKKWRPETPAEESSRAVRAGKVEGYGVNTLRGQIKAAIEGGLEGASFGATTVLQSQDDATREELNLLREEHPDLTTGGQVVGTVLPALLSGGSGAVGSAARATPAGFAANVGSRIAERGVGKGILKETAAAAAGGFVEGAAQNTGQYIAETALADKDLSAEGLLGAGLRGGFWGGAGGGAFGLTSSALTSARKLFPAGEVTEEAATLAERKAAAELDGALRDGDELEAAGRAAGRDYRHARVATDPAAAQAAEAARLKAMGSGYRDLPPGGAVDQPLAAALPEPPTVPPKPGRKAKPLDTTPGPPLTEQELDKLGKEIATPKTFEPAAELPANFKRFKGRKVDGNDMTQVRTQPPSFEDVATQAAEKRSVKMRRGAMRDMPVDNVYVLHPSQLLDRDVWGAKLLHAPGEAENVDKIAKLMDEGADFAPIEIDVTPSGRYYIEDGNHRLQAATRRNQPFAARFRQTTEEAVRKSDEPITNRIRSELSASADRVAAPAPAGDLESLLAQSTDRLKAGENIGDLNAVAKTPAQVEREVDDAVTALDPQAARLRQLTDEYAAARDDVKALMSRGKVDPAEYAAGLRKQADAKTAVRRAEGKLSRDADVIESPLAGRDPIPGTTTPRTASLERTSRLRDPYTDAELAAKSAANPTFRDLGDVAHGSPAAMTARSDLVDRILSGRTTANNLEMEVMQAMPGGGLGLVGQPATAQDVLDAIRRQRPDLSEGILHALRGRLDLPDDLPKMIPAVTRMEQAEANLVEALGADRVPAGAARRSTEYTKAAASHAEAKSLADIQSAQAVEGAAGGPLAVHGAGRGFLGHAADLGAALEVMGSIGIPGLPSAKDIPLIGPLLGLYLKARAASTIWRRMGGKMPGSAESAIAARAAATRDRVRAAIGALADSGARGARAARVAAPSTATILGRRLFADERDDKHREDGQAKPAEVWAKRMDELQRALAPGALAASLRDRVRTSDPRLAQAIEATALRRAQYLDQMRPRPPAGMALGGKDDQWHPPPSEAERFARIVEATDDPAAVLERAIGGDVSVDAIEAIRAVYPRLYAEAQSHLLDSAMTRDDIPYRRRLQLGILFAIPMDPTQDPVFMAKQQAGFAPPAPTPPPQPAMPPAPSPSIASSVDLSKGMMLQEMRP